ncbi:hypothetical protein [Streptomyces sp. NPDC060194]|uniref:hypothetical protein n=1 Tax=Streptomyces sp. NPDC060194 TaxID=3347069 RepID=UPI00365CBC1E
MLDVTPLYAAVERFADRLRAAPQSRLERHAAAEGLALARELARRAQLLEEPGAEPREMPDGGLFAAADQVAVAGRDLAVALENDPRADEAALAEAVALVADATARAKI